jgi:hypothetical protein
MAAMGRKPETAAIIRAFRTVGGRAPAGLFSGFVNFFMFASFLAVVVREFSSELGGALVVRLHQTKRHIVFRRDECKAVSRPIARLM